MYLARGLLRLGVAASTASLIFLAISFVLILLSVTLAVDEEASCINHCGEEYRKYMSKTSR
jgi:protein-S-isoprenylcysteine O-methyltransferase Ste14